MIASAVRKDAGDPGVGPDVRRRHGALGWERPGQASADGLRFDLAGQPAANAAAAPWFGSHVLWGERGSAQEFGIGDTSGPTGPSWDKGPITDADPRQPE